MHATTASIIVYPHTETRIMNRRRIVQKSITLVNFSTYIYEIASMYAHTLWRTQRRSRQDSAQ